MSKIRLAIVSTHPIQYYAPIFRALAGSDSHEPRVYYTWSQTADGAIYDSGFQMDVQWDIPLLDGYSYEFVPNVAKRPGSDHFWGIRNPTLISAIDRWRPDALLVHGWNLSSHLQAMRHYKGKVPVFFRGDSTLLDRRSILRMWARRNVLSLIYRYVDVALAVGENNREYYRWCRMPVERIGFARHSIDVRRFADADGTHERQAIAWRQEMGIGESELVVVYAGKFLPKKDPDLLLDAMTAMEYPAHLVFFGGGELERELRTRAAGRRRVHFKPFQNQRSMPAVYRVGDLFVLPSRGPGETWGLTMNEAMASGRVVIASSKVGGARDMIRHGESGWIFEAQNLPRLVEALREALGCGREELLRRGVLAQTASAQWSTEQSATELSATVAQYVRGRWRDERV